MGIPPNKKIPDSAAAEKPGDYPYIFGHRDTNGAGVMMGVNPNKPNESYRSEKNHDGSFETREISAEFGGMVTSHQHHERANAGSSSKNNDGNVDTSGQATNNSNVKGDSGSASGGTEYKGSGKSVGGAAEASTCVAPGGKVYQLHSDDVVQNIEKDKIVNVDGKHTSSIGGLCFAMIGGDYGLHVQGKKGIDIKADNDITIESKTKITLKVGKNSITINKEGIGIGGMADGGFVNIYAEDTLVAQAFGAMIGVYAPKGRAYFSGKENTIRSDKGTKIEASTAPPIGKVIPSA